MRACFLVLAALTAPVAAGPAETTAPVIGGTDVPLGKWRDTVALMFGSGDSLAAECTGVLVAPTVVLTAHHCLFRDGVFTPPKRVWIGTNSLAFPERGEDILVEDTKYHPGPYDLGLVILALPSTIPPRPLATGWVQTDIVDGAAVTLVGWGAIDAEARDYIEELREGHTIITDAGCTTSAGCLTAAQPDGELGAGGDGVDTCPGDSGGPLYLRTGYGEFLAGITSRGYTSNTSACEQGGIYTRPDKDAVLAWIEANAGVLLPTGRGPIADKIELLPGETVTVTVNANDPRPGVAHQWELLEAPALGTAAIDAAGVLTYTAGDEVGRDLVTVRAIDIATPTRSARGRLEVEVIEDGGCCQTGGATGRAWPALIVVAALLARRRRRVPSAP